MMIQPATTDKDNQKNYSRFIPSHDALIYCKISGSEDAPVLVLLHGNGEDLYIYNAQIRYFSQYFRIIAYDARAHGLSTRGVAPFNFYTFAIDLLAVLDTLKIDKAHIVGFSDGAITALHTALIAPERFSSMILLGANLNPQGIRWIPRLQILLKYAWLSLASQFSAEMREQKEIWGLMVHHPDLTIEEISQIKIPTLVVTGEKDMVSQRQNDEISNAITGSKRLIIPGGNHFWLFEQSDVFHQIIMDFLSRFVAIKGC